MPSPHPTAGEDYPRTLTEFQSWFATDEECYDYLGRLRWPEGFACPRCGVLGEFWRTSDRLWMCRSCGRQTSVTAGTIFDNTRTPLRVWFAAAWYIVGQKNGVSALGLQRALGLGKHETAWLWMHRFRRAMVSPERSLLSGVVEVDGAFVGGVTHGIRGKTDKFPIMVACEMRDKRPGRIRIAVIPDGVESAMTKWTTEIAAPGSLIRTDGAGEFLALPRLGFQHERHVEKGNAKKGHELLFGVHVAISLLKRYLEGTLHGGYQYEHLAYYLDEFVFRFNRRSSGSRGLLFYRLMQGAVTTEPIRKADIYGGNGPRMRGDAADQAAT